jgi:hypothetical protein
MGEELNISFLETSAKTADNVEAAFLRMAQQLIKTRDARGGNPPPTPDPIVDPYPAERKSCCK